MNVNGVIIYRGDNAPTRPLMQPHKTFSFRNVFHLIKLLGKRVPKALPPLHGLLPKLLVALYKLMLMLYC